MARTQSPNDTLIEAFTPSKIPADITACYLWLAATLLCIYVPVLNDSFLRIIFGVPVVLFIPGYALIAALFPGAKDIDGLERVALSFGLSIAIVPLTGLALNYTPWGIRLDPVVTCISLLTIGLCLAAQYRRALLPPEERFFVPAGRIREAVAAELFPRDTSRMDRLLSVILLIAIIAAVVLTVYVIVVPKEGEKFTEFFILGKHQKAADYPTTLLTGENRLALHRHRQPRVPEYHLHGGDVPDEHGFQYHNQYINGPCHGPDRFIPGLPLPQRDPYPAVLVCPGKNRL